MYLVVIDESSGQVTKTRKAQRGAQAALPVLRNSQCTVSRCVYVLISPTRCNPSRILPGTAAHRSPMPAAFVPLPRTRQFYLPCRTFGFSLGAAWFCSLGAARLCSSTASSASWLAERPFDVRPANRFISRGIFAPSLLAPLPCLLACLRRRYDKAPKFSRSRETCTRAFRPFCVSLYKTLSKRKHRWKGARLVYVIHFSKMYYFPCIFIQSEIIFVVYCAVPLFKYNLFCNNDSKINVKTSFLIFLIYN